MTLFLESSVAQYIGMALLHSIWQILLVAAIFAMASRLLANQSASLRYVLAYATLVLMLVLPSVTLLVVSRVPESQPAPLSEGSLQPKVAPTGEAGSESDNTATGDRVALLPTATATNSESSKELSPNGLVERQRTIAHISLHTHQWRFVLPWLAVAWSLGVIAFSLRPCLAMHRCRQMRKLAQSINSGWIVDTLDTLRTRIGLKRKVEVAGSSLVDVPTVIGFVQPIILLPMSMISGQTPNELSAIIAHELAHIRRHDFALNLFQTMIETLLFYHPAAWWISAVVRQERENCCDDIAMSLCGRKTYASALANLEFARSSQAGLGMAADGGSLYLRIHRIARPPGDPSPFGRRLAGLLALAVLLLGIVAILPVDAIVIAADQTEVESVEVRDGSETGDSFGVDHNSKIEDGQPKPANATRTYAGKVVDEQGQPVAGVNVYAENMAYDRELQRPRSRQLQSTRSATDGHYSLTFKPEDGSNQVIAAKEGFGPAIVGFEELHELFEQGKSQLDLQLTSALPITGRVVNTEGDPLGGVTVQVDEFSLPQSSQAVADWIANEQPALFRQRGARAMMMGNDKRVTRTAFPVAATVRGGSAIPGNVTTSADGTFRLDGLGENSRVLLTLSGPTICKRQAIVVTRQMKTVVAFKHDVRNGDFTHYGASPTLVATPTQPIVGRVVDANMRQPLRGVRVHLARAGKDQWVRSADEISDVTDVNGRFRLLGAPLGGEHVVEVHPSLDEPYFETKRELPVASGSAPLECDFELPPTQWIRGRVTDESGNPIKATLEFYPYRDNPYAEAFTKFDPRISGRVPDDKVDSNENGHFRIKAIPGRAVLAAVATDRDERLRYLPNRDENLLQRIGGQRMSKVYNGFSADYFDAMVEVELDADEEELRQDLVFKVGLTRVLNVTDDAGQPVPEVHAIGRTFPPNYQPESLDDSRLEIVGLQPNESRLVVLLNEQRELGKVLEVNAIESYPLDVRLLKCAVVTGRVVDEYGVGVENLSIRVSAIQEPQSDAWSRELKEVTTDAEGAFRVPIPPGGVFRLFAFSEAGPNFSAAIRTTSGATYDLGDLRHDDKLEEVDTDKLQVEAGSIKP